MYDMDKPNIVDFEAETKKLRKYFKFTEDDLAANRSGVLSEKQKQRIKKDTGSLRIALLIIGLILLAVTIYGVFGFDIDFFGIFPALLWGIVWGIPAVLCIVLSISSTPQLKLLSVRGPARFERGQTSSKHHSRTIYYDLYINDEEFDGDGDHFPKTMIAGAEYIVYYTQGSQQIVSAELISGLHG
jgi:hypothetical protein